VRNKGEILEAIKQQQMMAQQQAAAQAQADAQAEQQKAQGAYVKDMAGAQRDVAEAQKTQVETTRLAMGFG